MTFAKLILFLLIWCCLMAVPLKLGLLPRQAAWLEIARDRLNDMMMPLWVRLVPSSRRARLCRDLEIKATLAGLLDRYAPTAEQLNPARDDEVPRLRPEVAARMVKLHRRVMILGLGLFASDVHRTLEKARSQSQLGLLDDAREQIVALRGRISAHNYSPSYEYGYYPYVRPHPPINEVAEALGCGLGWNFLERLDGLCRVFEEDGDKWGEAIIAACSGWLNDHQDRVSALVDYIERYAGKVRIPR